jgi:hypothetical protein
VFVDRHLGPLCCVLLIITPTYISTSKISDKTGIFPNRTSLHTLQISFRHPPSPIPSHPNTQRVVASAGKLGARVMFVSPSP